MFKATLAKVSLLTDSIATIAELIEEGIFKIDKTGISLIAADRAMVAVVDFKISSSSFERYDIDKDHSAGINIGNLLSVLKRSGVGDKLTMDLKDSKLEIVLENASRRRFVIPLLDLNQDEIPPVDQLEFTTCVTLKPQVLQSGVDDAEVVSDAVLFEGSKERFGMRAEGDISSSQLELDKGNESMIDIKADGDVKARYPLDYLKKIMKAAKVADSVSLEWGQDYPMKLAFKASDKVSLSFILAPRVSEE